MVMKGRRHRAAFALLAALCLPKPGVSEIPVPHADTWAGAALMAGGKGYFNAPLGQLQYRDIGPRDARRTLLLLHQTWMSIVEFAQAQTALARLGYRSIAVDMPGHGMSDPPPGQPSIEEFADNLLPLLDALHLPKIVIVGHHTGAAIAASFAARHPDRVTAIILHGVPFLTAAEIDAFSKAPGFNRMPREDGSHMLQWYQARFPGDPVPNTQTNLDSRTWMLISRYFMGREVARIAVFQHDMRPDLLAIRAPTLILTDSGDPIHPSDQRAAKLRPDFTIETFSPNAGMSLMDEPERWAKVVAAYLAMHKQ